ncbi:MAG: DNA polymerase I, partial [Flammeovirgaceae bacterium]|nr:DNA polymerase I [Flammeovirgaceae bacterium]
MPDHSKTLFLLDAYALIYRAHFAFTKNPRINSKGHNTSVPFGFTNTLMEVLQKQKPTHIAVAFDTAAPTFRDEIFEEYKATRQETPEDIRYGIPIVKDIIRAFNIPILELDGFEADDIIGTIASKVAGKGFTVYMMTPDKDFGQLVTKNVLLYKPAYMGNSVDVMGETEVCEKWDIDNVSQVIDMLGMQGDSSDNIPGIPGFGPKTASKLLKAYGSVENIIKHAHELKGKEKERVIEFGEQALLSKKLATIITDVPVKVSEKDLEYTGPDLDKVKPIFDELEFKSMWNRLNSSQTEVVKSGPSQLSMFDSGSSVPKPSSTGKVKIENIESKEKRSELIALLGEQKEFSIVSAHDGVENFDYQLTELFFSVSSDKAFRIKTEDAKVRATVLKEVKALFEDPRIGKVGHNIKSTILLLKKYGIHTQGNLFDTMLAHYLL